MAYRLAVLIPCFNEAASIANVVANFRAQLPTADIYVFDNASTDSTATVARQAGAIVRREVMPGKGNVVRRMFADIDADVYVMVDGDDTYDAAAAPDMIARLHAGQLDMVVGARIAVDTESYRPGHRWGNKVLTGLVGAIFGNLFTDMLSGYRVFSRRFVKSFPAHSTGFEVETELTIHALELRLPFVEVPTNYFERGDDSVSKLNTYTDGWRILRTIVQMVREERPFKFFLVCSTILGFTGVVLGLPVFIEFLQTGLVPRLPTAVLATGLMLLAGLSVFSGLILDSVRLGRLETKRLNYLLQPLPFQAYQQEPVSYKADDVIDHS
ncbi:MAG: glycosyltransferase involved in cell wall biosynthesis [Candidatus Pseudothioglobus sp.]|jgi:glycosyltransferase involved in cell wall biosynthesis